MQRAGVLLIIMLGCSTTRQEIHPTIESPISACHISAPGGWMFQPQHKAKGKRLFEDIRLIGEYVVRGADGERLVNDWVVCVGQWRPDGYCSEHETIDKQDVEIGTCSTVIRNIIQSRAVEERGIVPGEDPIGNPLPPGKGKI